MKKDVWTFILYGVIPAYLVTAGIALIKLDLVKALQLALRVGFCAYVITSLAGGVLSIALQHEEMTHDLRSTVTLRTAIVMMFFVSITICVSLVFI